MDYYNPETGIGTLSFLVKPGETRRAVTKHLQEGHDLQLQAVTVGGKPLTYGSAKGDTASMYGNGASLRVAGGRKKPLRVRVAGTNQKPVRVTIRYIDG